MANKDNPFVISQLEEALEERQTPDRRKSGDSEKRPEAERRQGSRREKSHSAG